MKGCVDMNDKKDWDAENKRYESIDDRMGEIDRRSRVARQRGDYGELAKYDKEWNHLNKLKGDSIKKQEQIANRSGGSLSGAARASASSGCLLGLLTASVYMLRTHVFGRRG